MSDRAQRVLDALMEYDKECRLKFPIQAIGGFFEEVNMSSIYEDIDEDYESLTVDEEKQAIKAFLEFAY